MSDAAELQAREFAHEVVAALARVLPSLVGTYLHGSLTLGDFRPGRSDIDLLLIVTARLSEAEFADVRNVAEALARAAPAPIDVRIVTERVAAAPSPLPPMEFYVRLHPGRIRELVTRVVDDPDVLVELALVRAHGETLMGANATEPIGPVRREWVVAAGDRYLERWQGLTDDAEHAELMVLLTCRVWRLAVDRTFCSKTEAGRWALDRDPTLAAVAGALRRRGGAEGAVIEPAAIGRLLAVARSEIADATLREHR